MVNNKILNAVESVKNAEARICPNAAERTP